MNKKKEYKLSEETKAKMSAAQKGKQLSPETRARISAARKGMSFSEETKKRMSAAHTGKTLAPEHVANIIAGHKGKRFTMSEEGRKSISDGHKGIPAHENTKQAVSKYKNIIGRKVIINGVQYRSMAAAARALGIRYQEMVILCRYNPERAKEHGLTVDWVENKGE